MKIKTLEILWLANGSTRNSDDDQLQLFYGKNEAGKSTLQSFITSMLLGFSQAK